MLKLVLANFWTRCCESLVNTLTHGEVQYEGIDRTVARLFDAPR
jgi:hypothetical protein